MTRCLIIMALTLCALPTPAGAQEPLVQSLRGLFDVTKQHIMATARELNEQMYSYRPSDEVRSAGEILAHIADGQMLFCSAAAGESRSGSDSFEEANLTKAGTIRALDVAFAHCEAVFDRMTDADLGTGVEFFTGPNTAGGVLAFNSAHNYEHYGNLVTYMRLNGLVPPSSR